MSRSLRYLLQFAAIIGLFAVASAQPAKTATAPPAPAPDKAAAKPFDGAIIAVDAGHGGQSYSKSYTGGTEGIKSGMKESELNLKCAEALAKLFEDAGAKVVRTRTTNQRLSPEGSPDKAELNSRVQIFEHGDVHFFVSVHHNAGDSSATGHTAIFKKEVADDHLYKALATDVNDALDGVVPGPKRELIKGDYHLTRETDIPGTIVESGFMTNPEFDAMSTQPDYPAKEAAAIFKGALKFWTDNKIEIVKLRDELVAKRKANPRPADKYTAIIFTPDYQKEIAAVVDKMDPDKKRDPKLIATYIENYKKAYAKDEAVTGTFDGTDMVLSGEVSDRKYHDQIINALVAMKFFNIKNTIRIPSSQKPAARPTPEWQATPAPETPHAATK